VLALLATVHTGCFASAPNEMELYPTLGATDTVVTLSGVDFFTSSTIYCRIGKRMVLAEQNINVTGYGFIILCKAPRQSSGFHSVEITRNGRDFTNSGLVFQYVDVMIDSVFPQHVDPTGGTLVAVRGGGFQDGCYCDSGSATVIAAFSSSALLTCEVGAMIEDSIKDSKLYLSISVSRTQVAHQPYALQVAVTLLQKADASAVTLLISVLVCVLALSSSNSRKLVLRSSHTEFCWFGNCEWLLLVVFWLILLTLHFVRSGKGTFKAPCCAHRVLAQSVIGLIHSVSEKCKLTHGRITFLAPTINDEEVIFAEYPLSTTVLFWGAQYVLVLSRSRE